MWYVVCVLIGVIIGLFAAIESVSSRIATHFLNKGRTLSSSYGKMREILKLKYKWYSERFM